MRIFSHVFIGAVDVQKSAEFYDATLVHSVSTTLSFGNGWVLFGRDKPAFIIARLAMVKRHPAMV
jgi:hypothetical protein